MEKGLITTAQNQYYTIYTWIFETFFTVKFFLFLLKEFLRVLLLFCWYHLQDRFNFFPASCYRKATELWASASENCLIDVVGEDVVRRPNAGVLSARLIPAFAEVHMHILHILAPCLMYLRISSCGGTLWQDNRHIICRNKYSLAWKKNPEYWAKNVAIFRTDFWSFLTTNQLA